MSMQTAVDVALLIVADNSRSERRISPSWTIEQLKTRLEPITGVPVAFQKLSLKVGSAQAQSLEVDGNVQLSNFPLQQYAEIHVSSATILLALYC